MNKIIIIFIFSLLILTCRDIDVPLELKKIKHKKTILGTWYACACCYEYIFYNDNTGYLNYYGFPGWGYDLNAELTMEEKEIFLSKAADNDWILFFYHDPRTVAVKIKKSYQYFEVVDELRRK